MFFLIEVILLKCTILFSDTRSLLGIAALFGAKGVLKNKDFYYRKDKGGCFLTDKARKTFLSVFEQRMWEEATDPACGKSMNIRRHMEMQVQKLKEVLDGSRTEYEPYRTEW